MKHYQNIVLFGARAFAAEFLELRGFVFGLPASVHDGRQHFTADNCVQTAADRFIEELREREYVVLRVEP